MINLIKINNLKQLHKTNRNCYDLRIILNEAHKVVNINDNYFQLKSMNNQSNDLRSKH